MGASNSVIAGDYKNCRINDYSGYVGIWNATNCIPIDKLTVESYEILSEEHKRSAGNVAVRGLVGSALLGPVGLAAGVLSSRKKGFTKLL